MHREDLQFLVRTAIAARHPVELHRLLARHGTAAFADALSPWSVRAVEDGLALLAPAVRSAVFHQLPPATRDRLRAQPRPAHLPTGAATSAKPGWPIHRFAGLLDGWSGWPGLGAGRAAATGDAPQRRVRMMRTRASASAAQPSTGNAGAQASRAVAMTWAADL